LSHEELVGVRCRERRIELSSRHEKVEGQLLIFREPVDRIRMGILLVQSVRYVECIGVARVGRISPYAVKNIPHNATRSAPASTVSRISNARRNKGVRSG
jgi:hypothetical protein